MKFIFIWSSFTITAVFHALEWKWAWKYAMDKTKKYIIRHKIGYIVAGYKYALKRVSDIMLKLWTYVPKDVQTATSLTNWPSQRTKFKDMT